MRLRDKLATNEAAILAHLNAVNEVATLMQNAIQRSETDGTYSAGEFGVGAMIKFIVAAIWICAVTIGAVFYSFQLAGAKADTWPEPRHARRPRLCEDRRAFGAGAEDGGIDGYFLTRLVYTVEPEKLSEAVGAGRSADHRRGLFLSLSPTRRSTSPRTTTLDLDAFRNGIRDSINKRVGEDLVHDVLVEQIDFLSKDEIRDNTIRRRTGTRRTKPARRQTAKAAPTLSAGAHAPAQRLT